MKRFYHICLTAHSEVLLRNIDDVALFTNNTALSAYRTNTEMLTDSVMSTHLHETVFSDNVRRFATSQILSLTKAFNARHGRTGSLFDGKPYIVEIHGPRHMQMAVTYSLRQGLHHGQSETAFDYPWSTCNHIFTEERGVAVPDNIIRSRSELRNCFPKNADFPDTWQVDSQGILLRRSFEELSYVENWYGTARAYMYSMMRKTTEEWLNEQEKDEEQGTLITLNLLEKGYSSEDISQMLTAEGNSKYSHRGLSDMSVCTLIDTQMLGKYHIDTVYRLSRRQKESIAAELRHDVGVQSDAQISRCLAMNYHYF